MIKIAPSILAADFSRLAEEIKDIEQCGADMIHIDVMDGNFVPNITIGAPVVRALRKTTELEFDVHLMIERPENYIEEFANAGADIITIHKEACKHLHALIQQIKKLGKKAAVAINPATPISDIELVLSEIDMVLIMSVNPGFGGQSYIDFVTGKIKDLKKIIMKKEYQVDIQVDGGIVPENIERVARAGANIFVSGTTIFEAPDRKEMIKKLRELACC